MKKESLIRLYFSLVSPSVEMETFRVDEDYGSSQIKKKGTGRIIANGRHVFSRFACSRVRC